MSWGQGSFGKQFGIQSPGIISRDPPKGTEADTFSADNIRSDRTSGKQETIGRMVALITPEVKKKGEIYTFSGKIGWRYSSPEAAKDLLLFAERTGFFFAPKDAHSKLGGPWSDIEIGESPEGEWATITWTYTTTETDVGDPIYRWLEVHDENRVGGLTQLMADDWKVTIAGKRRAGRIVGEVGSQLPELFFPAWFIKSRGQV